MPLTAQQQNKFDAVCEKIAEGMSLRQIADIDGMPCTSTIVNWLNKAGNDDVVAQYARAKEMQSEARVDQMMDIAQNEPDVQRARLLVDTIKWTASKLKPKKYGDKIDHNVAGTITVHFDDDDAKL